MSISHNGNSRDPDAVSGTENSDGNAVADQAPGTSARPETITFPPPASEPLKLPDFVAFLPEQIWYLTSSGQEMWCRRPYGFFFSTSELAVDFAAAIGSAFELNPIGVKSKELVSSEGVDAMRNLGVHRLFIDPKIDPQTGDVFGRILRIEPLQ